MKQLIRFTFGILAGAAALFSCKKDSPAGNGKVTRIEVTVSDISFSKDLTTFFTPVLYGYDFKGNKAYDVSISENLTEKRDNMTFSRTGDDLTKETSEIILGIRFDRNSYEIAKQANYEASAKLKITIRAYSGSYLVGEKELVNVDRSFKAGDVKGFEEGLDYITKACGPLKKYKVSFSRDDSGNTAMNIDDNYKAPAGKEIGRIEATFRFDKLSEDITGLYDGCIKGYDFNRKQFNDAIGNAYVKTITFNVTGNDGIICLPFSWWNEFTRNGKADPGKTSLLLEITAHTDVTVYSKGGAVISSEQIASIDKRETFSQSGQKSALERFETSMKSTSLPGGTSNFYLEYDEINDKWLTAIK